MLSETTVGINTSGHRRADPSAVGDAGLRAAAFCIEIKLIPKLSLWLQALSIFPFPFRTFFKKTLEELK